MNPKKPLPFDANLEQRFFGVIKCLTLMWTVGEVVAWLAVPTLVSRASVSLSYLTA